MRGRDLVTTLTWQVLWPPAAVLLLATALAAFTLFRHSESAERLGRVMVERDNFDRSLAQLSNRHRLTMRRARGALNKPSQRAALLAWTSGHYLTEMERGLAELNKLRVHSQNERGVTRGQQDIERIVAQVNDIAQASRQVAAALDQALEAASADSEDDVADAAVALERADAALLAALGRTTDLVRKTFDWQQRELTQNPVGFAWPILLLLAASLPLALWLAARPIARVTAVSRRPTVPVDAKSREEKAISELLQNLYETQAQLTAAAEEKSIAAERATKAMRRAERELALLRLYNENLVNSLRSAILVTDAGGKTTACNRAGRHLLGVTDEHIGRPIEELALYRAFASRTANATEEIGRALSGETLRVEGLSFRRPAQAGVAANPHDSEILLDLTVVPYLDEGGAARGLLWVSDDITDAVRTKNQLLVAERLATVGRLSAQVAHEVRNPLSAIGLNAELLDEELDLVAQSESTSDAQGTAHLREAQALLAGIASEVERLSQITEGYLQLARMPRPECRDNDLNQLVSDLLTMVSPELQQSGVNVEVVFGAPPPRAFVDPGQLRQAMLNIVRNSKDAMPHGGSIRIHTTTDTFTGFAVLEFTDTGCGITPDIQRRVFEPFYSTKPNGTGLGLSLTEQIISEHNGRIAIRSVPEAQSTEANPSGTTVTLLLPSLAIDGPTPSPQPAEFE
jgi:signal transduction histidine kinase